MAENQGRDREIPRREAEMYRVEAIQSEMASAVRLLGGDGTAKEQVNRAARAAKLSHTTIERLRWKKTKRIPADIADAIREAVSRQHEEGLSRARHEALIERQRADLLAARLMEIDAHRFGPEVDALRRTADQLGGVADHDGRR